MADPDAPAWMLDDVADESTAAEDGTQEVADESENAAPVEAPKPPAEWRKTYKLAVSH